MNNSTTMAELIASIDWKWLIPLLFIFIGICVTIYIYYRTEKTNKKERRKAEIDKQLVKLYYPLMDILNNPLPNLRDEKGLKFDSKKVGEIKPFQNLTSDDLKDLIEEFIENTSRNRFIDMDNLVDRTNWHITYENFIEFVEADIKRLEEELKLIKL